jgi:hypothetical protein
LTVLPRRVTLHLVHAVRPARWGWLFLFVLLLGLGGLAGCAKTTTEDPPDESGPPTGSGPLTPVNPIPAAPAPQPTVRPPAQATPTPPPGGGDDPPPGGGDPPPGGGDPGECGEPTPPPLGRMAVGLLIVGNGRLILDSTPLVGPDAEYCKQIGFTDGRQFCPVRPEGNPERFACEAMIIGRARDTGRIGPTWSANGAPCNSGGSEPYCTNHPENQFLVFAVGSGTFQACASNGVCGAYRVP